MTKINLEIETSKLHSSLLIPLTELLLRWYHKYDPDVGARRCYSAAALEEALGDELREHYSGMSCRALSNALAKRTIPVMVSDQVARTWLEQHGRRDAGPSNNPPEKWTKSNGNGHPG